MTDTLSPEDATRLRVKYDTEYQFLVEHNVIDDGDELSRQELRDAIVRLTPSERKLLDARLYERRQRLQDLMDDDRKHFDESWLDQTDVDTTDSWAWRNR